MVYNIKCVYGIKCFTVKIKSQLMDEMICLKTIIPVGLNESRRIRNIYLRIKCTIALSCYI